jgi:bifunctional DNA-binding transcriptional regulator/antitoxin component of YhaV-PrlF toxin-antitoxin module
MIVEVNDAGDILVPAELVQAAPHTRLEADREGDAVILRPLAERSARRNQRIVNSLPVLEGRLSDPAMTFRREDIYGPDGR